ncbi:unnamed protein product [Arctia plantaginis]|uniref:BESS domain-containing protein n=1 Tax=Arctia plantaginis TaxID=874455 RepID=A0A8S0YR95_ARCPL|nr:unnamed protein product [Arctia plantaginis]
MPSLPSDITQSMSYDSDINQESNSQSHKDVVATPSLTSFTISPAASSSSATNELGEPPSDLSIQEPQRNPRLKKKKMSAPVPESASATLMKYVQMNRNNNTEHTEKEEQHPIDAFLQGLAPTLKSFSPYLQHLAKGQIFQVHNVIHNLELQQLTENLTSLLSTPIILSSPSPSSPSVPVISSPLSASEHSGTSDSIQLSEQPGSSESIQLYFSQYDTAND